MMARRELANYRIFDIFRTTGFSPVFRLCVADNEGVPADNGMLEGSGDSEMTEEVGIAEQDRPEAPIFNPFDRSYSDHPESWYPSLYRASPGFMDMEGIPSAYVAQQRHLMSVMRDFKRFSSEKPKGLPGMERVDFFNSQPVMNYSDPPLHTRLRKVVNPVFQPKRVAEMSGLMTSIIDDLLERISPGDVVDVVEHLTRPLATRLLLSGFLGIPTEDHHIMLRFSRAMRLLDYVGPGDPKPKEYLDAWDEGVAYCRHQIDLAQTGKATSVIGMIAAANEEGSLGDNEMMAMMVVLYIGGVGNVPSAASSSLLNLARNPDVARRVRADPALAVPVLEESLRLNSPVTLVLRFTVEDMLIGDERIKAGMPVYCLLDAACHDPSYWTDPSRFDIDRPNLKDHLALGYGMHTCIGNAITRATVPLLTAAVAKRFPNLSLHEGTAIEWENRPRARTLARVDLSF